MIRILLLLRDQEKHYHKILALSNYLVSYSRLIVSPSTSLSHQHFYFTILRVLTVKCHIIDSPSHFYLELSIIYYLAVDQNGPEPFQQNRS